MAIAALAATRRPAGCRCRRARMCRSQSAVISGCSSSASPMELPMTRAVTGCGPQGLDRLGDRAGDIAASRAPAGSSRWRSAGRRRLRARMDWAMPSARRSPPPNSRTGAPRHRPAADRPRARRGVSNGRSVRPPSTLNSVRTSCAPRAMGGVLAGENGGGRTGAGALCLAHRRHRRAERDAGLAHGRELALALAAHQRAGARRSCPRSARTSASASSISLAQRVGHGRAADQHRPAAAALLARPLRDRLADIAQRAERPR